MKNARSVLILTIFLLACVFAFPDQSPAAGQPMRVVVSGPYPPFAELDEDGNVYGFDVDIAEAVCKELNFECTITNMDFDEIIPAIVEGRVDFAVAGMGASPERTELVDFSDRYYRSVSIFIERKGSLKEVTPETIKGLRVGVQTGSLQSEYLTGTYGDSITQVTDPSYGALFAMLKNKEVDLVLSDGLPGYAYLTSEEGESLESIGSPVEAGGLMDFACITLPKGKDELRRQINEAIQTLRRNGEYDRINRRYFDFTVY